MAKDYAKATFKGARARREQRSRRRLFLFIFMFLFFGIATPLGWYLHQNQSVIFNKDNTVSWGGRLKSLLHRTKSQAVASQTNKLDIAANTQPAEPEVHFNFYTELPKIQVTLPVTQDEVTKGTPPLNNTIDASQSQKTTAASTKIVEKPAQIVPPQGEPMSEPSVAETKQPTDAKPVDRAAEVQYVVQVGAYKSDATASEMRVSILLAGFDATVVKTMLGNQVVYRIQQGPYPSLARAKAAQKKLQAKGFDGVVQKLS